MTRFGALAIAALTLLCASPLAFAATPGSKTTTTRSAWPLKNGVNVQTKSVVVNGQKTFFKRVVESKNRTNLRQETMTPGGKRVVENLRWRAKNTIFEQNRGLEPDGTRTSERLGKFVKLIFAGDKFLPPGTRRQVTTDRAWELNGGVKVTSHEVLEDGVKVSERHVEGDRRRHDTTIRSVEGAPGAAVRTDTKSWTAKNTVFSQETTKANGRVTSRRSGKNATIELEDPLLGENFDPTIRGMMVLAKRKQRNVVIKFRQHELLVKPGEARDVIERRYQKVVRRDVAETEAMMRIAGLMLAPARRGEALIEALKGEARSNGDEGYQAYALRKLDHPVEIREFVDHYFSDDPVAAEQSIRKAAEKGKVQLGTRIVWLQALEKAKAATAAAGAPEQASAR